MLAPTDEDPSAAIRNKDDQPPNCFNPGLVVSSRLSEDVKLHNKTLEQESF